MKKGILALSILFVSLITKAEEGMWLPQLLKQLNESNMKDLGMKLSAEDIYSINKSSLKDAVVQLGSITNGNRRGFCTAEIISEEGLILTNHHCGYGQIQSHSTVEKDLLSNGFWARSKEEELPNQGLCVTFIVKIDDVTAKVLDGVKEGMTEVERAKIIAENSKKIEADAVAGTKYEAKISSFFFGAEYYMFTTETFKDVRLVGAPPESIGKFGGDTDNWMWPRHTGDFSFFRIYADENNQPAEYSPKNKPYKPKRSLKISLKEVKEGDFTLTYGFPGITFEYLTSYGIEQVAKVSNPIKIKIREVRLDTWEEDMKKDPAIRIKYAAKHAQIANYYKKFKGENKGLRLFNGIQRKQNLEKEFTSWCMEDKKRAEKYAKILPSIMEDYMQASPLQFVSDITSEAFLGIEIFNISNTVQSLYKLSKDPNTTPEALATELEHLKANAKKFYKDYNAETDKKILTELFKLYIENLQPNFASDYISKFKSKYKTNYEKFANDVFKKSMFADEKKYMAFLNSYKKEDVSKLEKDFAFSITKDIMDNYSNKVRSNLTRINEGIMLHQRTYVQGLREMQPSKAFYPDANSTMRVAYGKVESFIPSDGAMYKHVSTLDGIIEKYDSTSSEFYVPKRLLELYEKKDYGTYDVNGKVPVAFCATNHTTGGNSGSPLIDANGNLIGLNFDTNWEGTMSNYIYNPATVRNICVDMHYVLFIVDKFAGASNLIKEMDIVR